MNIKTKYIFANMLFLEKNLIAKNTYCLKYQILGNRSNIKFSRFLTGYQWIGRHFMVINYTYLLKNSGFIEQIKQK